MNPIDVRESRLEVAKELGACSTLLFDPLQGGCGEIAEKLADALGQAPDVTIECSGSESGISLAIDVRYEAHAVRVSVPHDYKSLSVFCCEGNNKG